jgi:glycosyltransferase involved in cell wall biosynthesis
MNVLVVSTRFPWPPYSGDRIRANVWLEALAKENVALVAPPGDAPKNVRFYPAKRSLANGARGIIRTMREQLPWQSLLSAPYAWSAAIENARRDAGAFDATVLILERVAPWIPATEGRRILDCIDGLAQSMQERARQASPLTRWLWRGEAKRLAKTTHAADTLVFVSPADAKQHGGVAISNGVRIRSLEQKERRYDFGFWGQLAYFANADAAQWLVEEIWPAIRALRPHATLLIAGANASPKLRRDGITVISPADDMPTLARDVRVAILPLRFGTGESTKMLEAAEAGCAVVATPLGVRGLDALAPHAVLANDAQSIAREAVAALDSSNGITLREAVTKHYARELTLERLAQLVRAA